MPIYLRTWFTDFTSTVNNHIIRSSLSDQIDPSSIVSFVFHVSYCSKDKTIILYRVLTENKRKHQRDATIKMGGKNGLELAWIALHQSTRNWVEWHLEWRAADENGGRGSITNQSRERGEAASRHEDNRERGARVRYPTVTVCPRTVKRTGGWGREVGPSYLRRCEWRMEGGGHNRVDESIDKWGVGLR